MLLYGTVYSALEVIRELLKKSANQVLAENAAFIPLLADLVNDINGDVEDAARSLVAEITELIENHDVEPLLPALLEEHIAEHRPARLPDVGEARRGWVIGRRRRMEALTTSCGGRGDARRKLAGHVSAPHTRGCSRSRSGIGTRRAHT